MRKSMPAVGLLALTLAAFGCTRPGTYLCESQLPPRTVEQGAGTPRELCPDVCTRFRCCSKARGVRKQFLPSVSACLSACLGMAGPEFGAYYAGIKKEVDCMCRKDCQIPVSTNPPQIKIVPFPETGKP